MKQFILVLWLLPVVFMVHDFEEILFMRPWLAKSKESLQKRFPRFSGQIAKAAERSTAAFALAVMEIFVLLSVFNLLAYCLAWYWLWFAQFMAFALHLVFHLVQSIALKGYVPATVTSILALPYCIWGLAVVVQMKLFTAGQGILLTVIGLIVIVLNLFAALKLAELYDKRMNKKSMGE